MNQKQRYQLRKFINELSQIKGRHTELISVYIPAGYDIVKVTKHLEQEQSTAKNIKSKATRENVLSSLEKAIRHLKLYKKTPENGLAVFAGNASESESKVDIKVWSIEPPEPIKTRIYRCDQTFLLDILKDQLEAKEPYGLIVLDRREGNIGLLKGTNIEDLQHLTSGVPGKSRAGGQCTLPSVLVVLDDSQQIPISDLRVGDKVLSYNFDKSIFEPSEVLDIWEVNKEEYLKIEAEDTIGVSKDHILFTDNKKEKVAEDLTEEDTLLNSKAKPVKINKIEIIKKPTKMVDISVKNQNFIANCLIVHNSAARFERIREGMAKEFMKRIADAAQKQFLDMKELKGIIIGGPGPFKEDFFDNYLNNELKKKVIGMKDLSYTGDFGLNELVDKSKDLLAKQEIIEEKQILERFFETLAKEPTKVSYGKEKVDKALEMGAIETLLISEDINDKEMDKYVEEADKFSTEVKIISIESREGIQLKDIGGIAAILRYSI